MRSIKHLASRSLHNIGTAATKRIIKQFAAKYQFVYFGHVDPQEDEYELVRGLTVSTTHQDNHYTVGSYNGHDIVLLERRNTLTFPGKNDVQYRWLIMQIDLKRGGTPHMFVDCHHHDAMFYANVFMAQGGMQDISSYVGSLGPQFVQKCKLFANPSDYIEAGQLITPEVAETLATHFNQFDYEFFDDHVLVYASNYTPTPALCTEMLRIGTWLAEHINAQKP
jgi:hypothetical protein